MATFNKYLLVLFLTLGLAACSASKKSDDGDEFVDEDVPAADADTDLVPEYEEEEELADLEEEGFDEEEEVFDEEPIEEPVMDEKVAESDFNETPEETPVAPPVEEPLGYAATTPEPVVSEGYSAPSYSAGSGNFTNYTVQSGDTLMKIAFETYGDLYQWRRIYDANREAVGNYNSLSAGTVLRVEQPASPVTIDRNGTPYMIKVGDTLGTISSDVYGTQQKWRRLWENNQQLIRDPNKIYAGFYLYYTMTAQDEQEKLQFESAPPVAQAGAATVPDFQGATEAMGLEEPAPAPDRQPTATQ